MWGSPPLDGQRGLGISPTSHDRNGGSYRRMNRVGKRSCRDEEGLLLLLLFAEKQSERHGC